MKSLLVLLATALAATAFELPSDCTQAVVGRTASWDASRITVTVHEKKGGRWRQVGGPWEGRCGRAGMAWGRGLHPVPAGARRKREGDWRAPAGVFRIGGAWGYEARIRKHPKLFYRQVTPRDLWYEDAKSPYYNQWRTLKRDPATPAEKKAQMKQDDYPHSLKLFIAHNAPPKVVPGAGSAIFFHIWRGGGTKPTSGCTTLPEASLRTLIARIDPSRNPLYILLPTADYDRLRGPWKLP